MPATIQVVELALGDAVVDVDGGEQQLPGLLHLIQPQDACGGFLADTLHFAGDVGPPLGGFLQRLGQQLQDHFVFFVLGRLGARNFPGGLEFDALVDEQRQVTAVVDDLVGTGTVTEVDRPLAAPPIFFEGFTLPGEDRHAGGRVLGALGTNRHRGGGVVLRAENIARTPADISPQSRQRLDQHRCLDRHVQRTDNLQTLQRLLSSILGANRHQPRHLLLGQHDLLAAPFGQRQVADLELEFFLSLELGRFGHYCGHGFSR